MVVPGTQLHDDYVQGRFKLPERFGIIRELGAMISMSEFTDCFFTSNHASNYLPIRARMPRDKEKILQIIREVVDCGDPDILKPEFLRAL